MNKLLKIVRKRLEAHSPGSHPDPDLLAAFAERSLREHERATVLAHLALCRDCRDVVALAAPIPLPSETDTISPRRVPWFSWPMLRWGAVAACLVVVGSAVVLHQASQKVSAPSALKKEVAAPAPQSPSPKSDQQLLAYESKQLQEPDSGSAAAVPQSEFSVGAKPQIELRAKVNRGALASTPAPPPPEKFSSALVADQVASGGIALTANEPVALTPDKTLTSDKKEQAQNLPLQGRNLTGPAEVAPRPSTQRVDVAAQANALDATNEAKVETDSPETLGKAKGAGESTSMPAAAPAPAAAMRDLAVTPSARLERAYQTRSDVSRWTISSDGHVQHSIDSGRTWQPVEVADKASFRALSANGPDLWVGGAAGLLYHSSDAGQHWVQVNPKSGDAALTADIAAIEFTDIQHGKITTATGEIWTTSDGGRTWLKKN